MKKVRDGQNHKSRLRMKNWLVAGLGVFLLHSGFLFIEAVFFNGDMRAARLTIVASVPFPFIAVFLYSFARNMRNLPVYLSIAVQLVFLVVGTYLRELDFYFFIMLLVIGTVTITRDFSMMAAAEVMSIVINILAMIFLLPRLNWLNQYRFFMEFAMYLLGTMFMLIQTYNVARKESRSERGLAAFSSLLGSTPNLMAITDAECRVLYLSAPMAKFIRCPRVDYAVGRPLIDLIADKGLKIMFADMLDADGFFETVMEINVDGEERYFKVVSDKLSGDAQGNFIDISDITPTVQSNLAAMDAQVAAEEANKTKSNFLATMSHEIRTPMNAIIGIAQIQLQKGGLPAEYADALEKIYSSGNNLLGIINDILDMSKIETGRMELVHAEYDVPSMINDAVQLNIVRIGSKPIEFKLELEETLPSHIIGDELRLKQILNNILSNAIKYTDKGTVSLSVNHRYENGDIMLRFVVEDTGQGMKPQDLKKLFSEYLRFNAKANRATEGTGLGLSITRKLIEMMNGTIDVQSEYGKGSVFIVSVRQKAVECQPIGAELAERLRNFTFTGERYVSRLQINRVPMPYGKVLVVDDVDTNLYVTEGLLSPYKLKIETVNNGFEAINRIKSGNIYDVIFMDHMMPEIDGIETTAKIRKMGYTGTIIALTANAISGNDEIFAQNGFDGFISKPIDVRDLNAALNKFVRDRHTEEASRYPAEIMSQPETAETGETDPKHIKLFRGDAQKAMVTLRETESDGDLKRYAIAAHAMKPVLANIGEQEASQAAARLEKAAKNGDAQYIAKNNEGFIKTLGDLIVKYTPGETQHADMEYADMKEDTEFLVGQLQMLKTACVDYDDGVAYAVLDTLKSKVWTSGTTTAIEEMYTALFLHSDFDGVAERVAKFCKTSKHAAMGGTNNQ